MNCATPSPLTDGIGPKETIENDNPKTTLK